MVQTTFPALTLSNVGNGPQQDELHLEGAVNLPAQSMEVQFWQGAGNVLTQGNGSEARIEDGKAFVRPAGGSWEEVTGAAADFSSSFAPGADPLAFLAGMKNVRLAPVSANPLAADAAHYAFDLDGPAFATHLRDQLEEQLRERGELPLNVSLQTSSEFREAQGEGELWVDGRGLPLRLSVHLVFAGQVNGAHVEADITTDFSGFPERLAAGPQLMERPLAWAGAALGLDKAASSPAAAAKTCGPVGSVAFGFGALALLVGCRRSRRLYAAVVIAVTLSMVARAADAKRAGRCLLRTPGGQYSGGRGAEFRARGSDSGVGSRHRAGLGSAAGPTGASRYGGGRRIANERATGRPIPDSRHHHIGAG